MSLILPADRPKAAVTMAGTATGLELHSVWIRK